MTYYILNGDKTTTQVSAIDYWTWVREDKGFIARRVNETLIGDIRVSTVFLGLDHNYFGGPPHIFETMSFGTPLGHEEHCERCSTYLQALTQHALIVGRIRHELGYEEEKKPFRLIEV